MAKILIYLNELLFINVRFCELSGFLYSFV